MVKGLLTTTFLKPGPPLLSPGSSHPREDVLRRSGDPRMKQDQSG